MAKEEGDPQSKQAGTPKKSR
jgi:hypothetical protein